MAGTTVNTMLRTSSGTVYFDALLHADHNATVIPTQHPVQTGAAITDHAYMAPKEISLEIGMTDVVSGTGASARAYQQFLTIMAERDLVTVVTRLGAYQDMLLTAISVPDDYTTMNSLRCTLTFTEIRVATVATVTVQGQTTGGKTAVKPAAATTSGKTAKTGETVKSSSVHQPATQKPASTAKQSVLHQLFGGSAQSNSNYNPATASTSNAGAKIAENKATNAAKTAPKASTVKATIPATKPINNKVNTVMRG